MRQPALTAADRAEILRRVAARLGVAVDQVEALAVEREDVQSMLGEEILRAFDAMTPVLSAAQKLTLGEPEVEAQLTRTIKDRLGYVGDAAPLEPLEPLRVSAMTDRTVREFFQQRVN